MKIKNNIIIIIASIIVLGFLCIDFIPNMMIDTKVKLAVYIFAMFIVFIDMKLKNRKIIDEKGKEKNRKKYLLVIFIIYSVLIATLLFLDSKYGRFDFGYRIKLFSKEHFEYFSNFIPFKTIFDYFIKLKEHNINLSIVLTNFLGNIIVFAPYGILVPIIFKEKFSNFKNFFLLMIAIVLSVEIVQFVTKRGILDIDDLILNVLGAVIFFGIAKIKPVEKFIKFVIK